MSMRHTETEWEIYRFPHVINAAKISLAALTAILAVLISLQNQVAT